MKVTHDPGQDRLYWPVILYYPEHKISELIAKFDEESTFNDHLSVMFDDERAPWDEKYNYNNRAIIVFFEHRSRGLPHTRKPRIRKVNKADCLRKILQDPEMAIVDGCATFLLLSRNSPFYETALRNYEVA